MIAGDPYHGLDQLVARLADALGVRITRARPVDCTGDVIHPVAAYYAANGRPVVFDAPLKRLRGLGANAFPCHPDSSHPYVLALNKYRSGRQTEYAGSTLERFHRCWQPRSAAEYLGLDPSEGETRLGELCPEMAVLPWQKEGPEEWFRVLQRSVVKDQRRLSQGVSVRTADWHDFGPMSAAAGSREWRRLLELQQIMERQGYQRSARIDGDIKGQLLLDDTDGGHWCFWILGGGQHRAGVAGALGYTSVPVRLAAGRTPLVMRSHVGHWPNVRSGLFTVESALRVFDRVVAGCQPFPWAPEGDNDVSGPGQRIG